MGCQRRLMNVALKKLRLNIPNIEEFADQSTCSTDARLVRKKNIHQRCTTAAATGKKDCNVSAARQEYSQGGRKGRGRVIEVLD